MKKVLATVAALGLVLGVAGNVLALDKPGEQETAEATDAPRVPQPTAPGVSLWSVSGSWVLAGAYINNANGNTGDGGHVEVNSDLGNDAFYIHSFKILPVLQVNDKVAVKGELRFIDRSIFGMESTTKGAEFNSYHLYLEYMSAVGKTRFGRTPGGAWGSKFGDSTGQRNRIMWWPNFMPENWDMLLFTAKRVEADVVSTASDQDRDGYYAHIGYKSDMGKTTAAIYYARNATAAASDPFATTKLWLHGKYAMDNLALEYEVDYNFGEHSATMDEAYYGAYADLSMKSGDMTFGGKFFIVSGDDDADNDEESWFRAVGTIGNDFNPYQIMCGDYMGMLNADKGTLNAAIGAAGVWSIGGYASMALSPKMSISGEIGYFAATDELTTQDDELGWEIGVGMSYKLYNNLTYGAHFSYLATGDFFKGTTTDAIPNTTEDIYVIAHSLSMKF